MSYENIERLRDESLVLLSRIKTSKIKCFQIMYKNNEREYENNDGSLEYWNDQMLHDNADEAVFTYTAFYQSLLKFREYQSNNYKEKIQKLQEMNNKYSPKASSNGGIDNIDNTRLYPPGKIIYLARNSKTDKFSSTAIFANNTDFDEILITKTTLEDHYISKNIKVFEHILHSFDNPIIEDDGSEVEIDEKDHCNRIHVPTIINGAFIKDNVKHNTAKILSPIKIENEFYCCSRPHGHRVFIPAVLAIIALVVGSFGNNDCNIVNRITISSSVMNDTLTTSYGLNTSTGLWSFEKKEYIVLDEISSTNTSFTPTLVGSGICSYFPKWYRPDSYIITARVSAVLSPMFGLLAAIPLWFSTCKAYRSRAWRIMQSFLFLATIFQVLVLLMLFNSNLCHKYAFSDNAFSISKCSLGQGAKLCISACTFYFFATVSMSFYPKPS